MADEVRIGVYVCRCQASITTVVDVDRVTELARSLPPVVVARSHEYTCSDAGQGIIRQDIVHFNLNRVVVAACSPLVYERTFRQVLKSAGLNPYLLEMANIREHCAWVTEDPKAATEKASDLVRAAVKRVALQEPLEIREVPVNPNTLVVGGGVAGIHATLQIAHPERRAYLVEREPSPGGRSLQLAETHLTPDCVIANCVFPFLLNVVDQHPHIELMTYSEVVAVSGHVGDFKVKIRKKARYIDIDLCNSCLDCLKVCPVEVPSEFDLGLTKRKAIYRPFPRAVPNAPLIDREHCDYFLKGTCKECLKVCRPKAIDLDQEDEIVEIGVGNIIIATGFDPFDPSVIPEYGYGRLDNVITALQFERLCDGSGSNGGQLRLKDGSEPERVAIIHCVGSRDKNYNAHCSQICCLHSLKHAQMIKEKTKAEVYQFYIDMRSWGKGFEEFYRRVSEEGVNFIRGKVAEVTDHAINDEEKGRLIVVAEDTLLGTVVRVPVDMVILSTALQPRSDAEAVARLFNLERSDDGFLIEAHPSVGMVTTATSGVFVVGCAQGPKDISQSVTQASAAAARVLAVIDRGKVALEPCISQVVEENCDGCAYCVDPCPFDAITLIEYLKDGTIKKTVEADPIRCRGCGICQATCPKKGITVKNFTLEQISAMVNAMLGVA